MVGDGAEAAQMLTWPWRAAEREQEQEQEQRGREELLLQRLEEN